MFLFPTLSFARDKGESTERTLEKICLVTWYMSDAYFKADFCMEIPCRNRLFLHFKKGREGTMCVHIISYMVS